VAGASVLTVADLNGDPTGAGLQTTERPDRRKCPFTVDAAPVVLIADRSADVGQGSTGIANDIDLSRR
jgi:hypothetical protein